MAATFAILGRTALLVDGVLREDWGRPRERAVLATLLVHPGRWVSIDTLLEWAWPDDAVPPRDPASTFHNYATRIRKWLRRLPSSARLEGARGGYRLDVDLPLIDYQLFHNLISRARRSARNAEPHRAIELARQALQLWRGQPLDDLTSERARAWRIYVVQNEWLLAYTTLLQALIDVEEYDDALGQLDELHATYSFDVRLATLRLSALYGLARYDDAVAYYLSTRHRLLYNANRTAAEHLRLHHDALQQKTGSNRRAADIEPATVPHLLPHNIIGFVGRRDLLATLHSIATVPAGEPPRGIVVLDGMAGVGKTALAVHWAHAVRDLFPGGDFYVNLNGFADAAKVNSTTVVSDFLIALGHPPHKGMSERAKELLLGALLAARPTLILLDNARDTAHIKDLLPLMSSSLVLITSRQRLSQLIAATGARRVHVDLMSRSEAIELLANRLRPHHHVDADRVVQIATLCGGLPLAIIILAEHVTGGTETMSWHLANQFDRRQLITDIGEDGDGPPSNLHTFFMWSYRALAEAEQRIFRLLGLHPGPDISLEAASAYAGGSLIETTRSIKLLAGAHLIESPEVPNRYRFHDLLAEFAALRANADEPGPARLAAQRRCVSFYLSSAAHANRMLYPTHLSASELPVEEGVEAMAFRDTMHAKQWFERERTNLVAIARHASTLGLHDHVWRLVDEVTTFLDRHGHYASSRSLRELAVVSGRLRGDRVGESSSLVGLGMINVIMGEHRQARQQLEAALDMVEADGQKRGQVSALHQLGRLEMARGNPPAALTLYQRCLDLAHSIDDHDALCWAHCRLGEALVEVGQHDRALSHLHQAQWFAERIDDRSAHASSLAAISSIYLKKSDYHAAASYCALALDIAETLPDLEVATSICTQLAEIESVRGNYTEAAKYAERAVTTSNKLHDIAGEARARDVLGDVHAAYDDTRSAIASWQVAATLYDRIDNHAQMASISAKVERLM